MVASIAAALERAAHARTRAVLVVSPNNPTGSFVSPEELDRLAAVCRARTPRSSPTKCSPTTSWQRARAARGRLVGAERRPRVRARRAVEDGRASAGEAGMDCRRRPGSLVAAGARAARARVRHVSVGVDAVQVAAPSCSSAAPSSGARLPARVAANYAAAGPARGERRRLRRAASRGRLVRGPASAVVRVGRGSRPGSPGRQDGVLTHPGYFFDFPRESYLVVSLLPADAFDEGVSRLLARADSGHAVGNGAAPRTVDGIVHHAARSEPAGTPLAQNAAMSPHEGAAARACSSRSSRARRRRAGASATSAISLR